MDKALDLLNVMISKGLYPDTTTYQSLAFGLSREDGMDRAIGMFSRVQDMGLSPDTMLSNVFVKIGEQTLLSIFFAYMVSNGVMPDESTYITHRRPCL